MEKILVRGGSGRRGRRGAAAGARGIGIGIGIEIEIEVAAGSAAAAESRGRRRRSCPGWGPPSTSPLRTAPPCNDRIGAERREPERRLFDR